MGILPNGWFILINGMAHDWVYHIYIIIETTNYAPFDALLGLFFHPYLFQEPDQIRKQHRNHVIGGMCIKTENHLSVALSENGDVSSFFLPLY